MRPGLSDPGLHWRGAGLDYSALVTRLVVGLGNPGPDYEWTRHNVGFHVLDRLALHEGTLFQHAGERAGTGLEGYGGPPAFRFAECLDPDGLLLKPETFMNRSGEVVEAVAGFLGTPPESILVVTDDMDLDPGMLRLRPFGGAGGHNGMRSIIERLGSDRFCRLRIGIGRSATDAVRHVLDRIPERERVEYEISFAEASEAVLDWLLEGDIERCMSRFHSRWKSGP